MQIVASGHLLLLMRRSKQLFDHLVGAGEERGGDG
jgi:hypothetical protein